MNPQLNNDFKEFLQCLQQQHVNYIIVGGYAVVYHGYNRTTGDLDIWVEPTPDNFQKLMAAFAQFGFPTGAITETDFLGNENDVYTFGVPPVCIEILTTVKGLTFKDSFAKSSQVMFDGVQVNMIDARDLKTAKKAAGRYKDLDDLENLT